MLIKSYEEKPLGSALVTDGSKPSVEQRQKHVLRLLRLYGDQALVSGTLPYYNFSCSVGVCR